MDLIRKLMSTQEVERLLLIWEQERVIGWLIDREVKKCHFTPCLNEEFKAKALLYLPQARYDELTYVDSFFIYYTDGDKTEPHMDGRSGKRINVLLKKPEEGVLRISDRDVPMEVGDAVVFYPDKELHEVTPVKGERLIWSVGRARTPPTLRNPQRKKSRPKGGY